MLEWSRAAMRQGICTDKLPKKNFCNRQHSKTCKIETIIYLQVRVLCLHLEKLNLLKIFPANFGLKMTYLHFFHVEMNILLLLQVSTEILSEDGNPERILDIIDVLCFKHVEYTFLYQNNVFSFFHQRFLDNVMHQGSVLNFKSPWHI